MEKIVKNQFYRVDKFVAGAGFEPASKGYEPFKATSPPPRDKFVGNIRNPCVETIMHLHKCESVNGMFLNSKKSRTIHFVHSDNVATKFNGLVPLYEQHYNF